MTDMTVEKAREIISLHETDWRAYSALVSDMMKELGGHMDCPFTYAKAYLVGHASRDPEVEKLKADLKEARMQSSGCFEELLEKREASRKLVEAAKKMADQLSEQSDAGERYLTATEIQFREALSPYFPATPQASGPWPLQGGHSPEGETL